jgi:hypothetical protein
MGPAGFTRVLKVPAFESRSSYKRVTTVGFVNSKRGVPETTLAERFLGVCEAKPEELASRRQSEVLTDTRSIHVHPIFFLRTSE